MKSKKFLSIFFLVVVITTVCVPFFSISSSAVVDVYNVPQYRVLNTDLDFSMFDDNDDLLFDVVLSIVDIDSGDVITSRDGILFSIIDDTLQLFDGDSQFEIVQNGQILESSYRLLYIQSFGDNTQVGYSKLIRFFDVNSVLVDNIGNFLPFLNDFADEFYTVGYGYGLQEAAVDYNKGYEDGVNESFGKNLILGILSTPAVFLDGLTLFEYDSLSFSIWDLFTTAVGISLFVWFLKMFAGG